MLPKRETPIFRFMSAIIRRDTDDRLDAKTFT